MVHTLNIRKTPPCSASVGQFFSQHSIQDINFSKAIRYKCVFIDCIMYILHAFIYKNNKNILHFGHIELLWLYRWIKKNELRQILYKNFVIKKKKMEVVLRLKRGGFYFGLNVNFFCFKIQQIPKVDVGREFLYFSLFI